MAERCMVCRSEKNTSKLDNRVVCCYSCKNLFTRLTNHPQYLKPCNEENHRGRKKCRYCFYQTCLRAGIGGQAAPGGV